MTDVLLVFVFFVPRLSGTAHLELELVKLIPNSAVISSVLAIVHEELKATHQHF